MRLDVSARAQRDIDAMHAYGISQFGKSVADDYARGLLDLFDLLERNPLMGAEVTLFNKKTRRFHYQSHIVFYRVLAKSMRVIRVQHARQNWQNVL